MTAAKIAALNDAARREFVGCRVVITRGIAAMPDLDAVYAKVRGFTDFSPRNDPHGEHDFGALEHEGQTLFWKFDYYDPELVMASLDPSDPTVTCRVLTIMLAEDY
jgi:hypothetical protein